MTPITDHQIKEQEYQLNLLYLRNNHERQQFKILYIQSAEDGKLCGEQNRNLIPTVLHELANQSKEQIKLAETLLNQLKTL